MDHERYRRFRTEFHRLVAGERLSRQEAFLVHRMARSAAAREMLSGDAAREFAERWVASIRGTEPLAFIIGESPGPRGHVECPLFPYPAGSSGGRCMGLAGYQSDPVGYLQHFARADAVAAFPLGTWPKADAAIRVQSLISWASGLPVLLLGARAAAAAGAGGDAGGQVFRWFDAAQPAIGCAPELAAQPVVWLPHPSSRNRSFNGGSKDRFKIAFHEARAVGMARREEAMQRRQRVFGAFGKIGQAA